MPLIQQQVHPLSLNFENQRKAYLLRTVDKLSYTKIAKQVTNLKGRRPCWTLVRRVCQQFSKTKGYRVFNYANCGREPWKLTDDAKKFLIRRLLGQRQSGVVTSTSLQCDLAREMHITAETSGIRKLLSNKGYKWLPRAQKTKFTPELKRLRCGWAQNVVNMTPAELKEAFDLSMDGVVIAMPPVSDVERLNFCLGGETHMWRKPGEAASNVLAGNLEYSKQVPMNRAIPLWGGVSRKGFAVVLYHLDSKKLNEDDWSEAVRAGKLTSAIKSLRPSKPNGPWRVLTDNESFLRTPLVKAAYRKAKVTLWAVPPKSPDLNPVERFWSWLRRRLRALDLADVRARRRPLSKAAYVRRVQSVIRSQKAQTVGANIAKSLRKTCLEVLKKKGAGARG